MKKELKAVLSFALLLFLLIAPISAAEKELHWYCKKNSEHRQIAPIPEFSFVEELGGYYIDRNHGDNAEEKVVYLTFDAGYENGNVEKVLDALREKEASGAFFVLKHLVTANTELVCRMMEEGHLVCNHTAHHPNLAHASEEKIKTELSELEEAVLAMTGKPLARYFRPPEGSFSRGLLETVNRLGYRTVFWSFAYADWDNQKQMAPSAALEHILKHIHNGAVLLLHPTSATNAEILPWLIDTLRGEGYRFGTLDELCGGA